MSKEFEGGETIKPGLDVIVIVRQDVSFSKPPESKTEEQMIAFIHKEGFSTAMRDPEERCLLIDEGLGIGPFRSLEEMYDYVKKGYPAVDIERYKNSLAAIGYPADFHKLPPEIQNAWDDMPEEVKQAVREKGAGIFEMVKFETRQGGKRVIHPNPKFQPKHQEKEKTKEEQRINAEKCVQYILKSGFQLDRFDDGSVGIAIDDKQTIGHFSSLEDAVRYLKEGHHLIDITVTKMMDDPTVH